MLNIADIIGGIRATKKKMELNLPAINSEIEKIILEEEKNPAKIENLLDVLLNYSQLNVGEQEFKKLNKYYESVDKENAESYYGFYEIMVREDK